MSSSSSSSSAVTVSNDSGFKFNEIALKNVSNHVEEKKLEQLRAVNLLYGTNMSGKNAFMNSIGISAGFVPSKQSNINMMRCAE